MSYDGYTEAALAEVYATHTKQAAITVLAKLQANLGTAKLLCRTDMRPAGRGKVPEFRMVGSFDVNDCANCFRDQEINICITPAMAMGAHIDGHAVDPGRKVCTVIKIEAAQEYLVGFTRTTVLGDHHAGHQRRRTPKPERP